MHGGETNCPGRLAGEQSFDHFRREGREGRQAAEKTGDGEQFPGQRKMGVDMEHADRDADQIAADQVGRQRAERQGDEQRVERQPEQPARPGAEGGAEADGEEIQGGKVMQGGNR